MVANKNISVQLFYINLSTLAYAYNIIIDRSFNVNDNCETTLCRSSLITDINDYLNCKHRHCFSKGISKTSFRPNTGTWLVWIMVKT